MEFKLLKEKVDALEKTLLAIDSVNNVCQEAIHDGSKAIDLDHCAYLLNYLIEPAMYQIESIRILIDDATAPTTSPKSGGSCVSH
jgi:hypothetical protein